MKIIKIFIFLIFLILLSFIGYIFKYQQLVNEGSKLAEERCQTIDPILFNKQKEALEYFQLTQEYKDIELINEKIDNLKKTNEKLDNLKKMYQETIKTSELWMKKQKEFINRWDFKFFTHKALVDVFYAQYEKYQLDLESNKLMLSSYSSKNIDETTKQIVSVLKKMDDAQKVLDEKIKVAANRRDFRYYFIKIPSSNCPTNPLFAPPSHINPNKPIGRNILIWSFYKYYKYDQYISRY